MTVRGIDFGELYDKVADVINRAWGDRLKRKGDKEKTKKHGNPIIVVPVCAMWLCAMLLVFVWNALS